MPINITETPIITGKININEILTVSNPIASTQSTASYRWFRGIQPIPRATLSGYKLTSLDRDNTISCVVTNSFTTESIKVLPNPIINITRPKLIGKPFVQATLTVDVGQWMPSDVTFTYQWYMNQTIIDGETNPQYKLSEITLGNYVTCAVTAHYDIFTFEILIIPWALITSGIPVKRNTPSLSGIGSIDKTLTVDKAYYTTTDVTIEYAWYKVKPQGLPIKASGTTTSLTYIVTDQDVDYSIFVAITASDNETGASSYYTTNKISVVDDRVNFLTTPYIVQDCDGFKVIPSSVHWRRDDSVVDNSNVSYKWFIGEGIQQQALTLPKGESHTRIAPYPATLPGAKLTVEQIVTVNNFVQYTKKTDPYTIISYTPVNTQLPVLSITYNEARIPTFDITKGNWSTGTDDCVLRSQSFKLTIVNAVGTEEDVTPFTTLQVVTQYVPSPKFRGCTIYVSERVVNNYGTTIAKSVPVALESAGPMCVKEPKILGSLNTVSTTFTFDTDGGTWDPSNITRTYKWTILVNGVEFPYKTGPNGCCFVSANISQLFTVRLETTAADTYGSTTIITQQIYRGNDGYITELTPNMTLSSPSNWTRTLNTYKFTGQFCSVLFDIQQTTGQVYVEITIDDLPAMASVMIGVQRAPTRVGSYHQGSTLNGNGGLGLFYYGLKGYTHRMVIDLDTQKMNLGNIGFTLIPGSGPLYLGIYDASSRGSGTVTINWGRTPFTYQLPAGAIPIGQLQG